MTTLRRVFLVVGEAGDHHNYRQWCVAAYIDEEAAEQHAKLCNDVMNSRVPLEKFGKFPHQYDKDCVMKFGGTSYNVEQVELFRHVDEYQNKHLVKV